jgi:hypothetical protein
MLLPLPPVEPVNQSAGTEWKTVDRDFYTRYYLGRRLDKPMKKIEMHFTEDGYYLQLGEQRSEVMGYGEAVEVLFLSDDPRPGPFEWVRYLAFADVGEKGDVDDKGGDLEGVTFSPTQYWAYKVVPLEDDEIEFIDEDEPIMEPVEVSEPEDPADSGAGLADEAQTQMEKEKE